MNMPLDENYREVRAKFLRVKQPLGEFLIASISAKDLVEITDFDVRRVIFESRDVERYLGIQRPLSKSRVHEISEYVTTIDACFPTGVIISVPLECVQILEDESVIVMHNVPQPTEEGGVIHYKNIARVLDGQHRLAGLRSYKGDDFYLNVSIFIDADIADQANIFSTVNLAQTKVNKSLAYDLFDLAQARSPQKVAHKIVVILDRDEKSPFHKMIKRLGVATQGRQGETLTQATVVNSILPYLSTNPMRDRDIYLRHRKPEKLSADLLLKAPFQHMFVEEQDFEITDIIWNYFTAVKQKWGVAWASRERGNMLNRTNGFQAFARFLKDAYLSLDRPNHVPSIDEFAGILSNVRLQNQDFSVDNYDPGTSGASKLYRDLMDQSGLSAKRDRQGRLEVG